MKRLSSIVSFLVPSVLALAAFSCVGDDPVLGGVTADAGGSADGATADGSGNVGDGGGPGNDGGADLDADAAATPPYIPVVGHYIKSTHPKLSYGFGGAIALSADGNTLAVGSEGEDSAATGVNNASPGPNDTGAESAGAVFVFSRSAAGVWTQQAYIKANNTATEQRFGCSVSLSSDGNRLAVGAKGEDTTFLNSGAVYLYQRTGSTWAQIPSGPLKAGVVMAAAEFGTSVALSGDGNSLAVGSFNESATAVGVSPGAAAGGAYTGLNTYRGAVNVYTYANGVWGQTHYIKPSIMQDGARFGASVALNGAGSVLIVGSQGENSGTTGVSTSASSDGSATGAGAAYVFAKNLGAWSQAAYVKPSNTRQNARFGVSVAVAANGQSFAVGSNFETSGAKGVNNTDPGPGDTTATNAGAAYVFAQDGSGVWAQTAYLKASNTRANASFGRSVGLSLDGRSLIVGSPAETSAATGVNNTFPGQADTTVANGGAAYLYALVAGGWTQTAYLKSFTTTTRSSNFGSAVAITNGATSLAVGAVTEPSADTGIDGTLHNTAAGGSGAAFTFE